MLKYLSVCCLILSCSVYSQIFIKGKIQDAESFSVLPYVNIQLENSNKRTISNKSGLFQIALDSNYNVLKISCFGYETKSIQVSSSNDNLVIVLLPKAFEMMPVEVLSTSWEEQFVYEAIRVKNEMKKKLNFYSADAYSKIVFRKSNGKIIGLIESASTVEFKKPDLYRERLLVYKPPPQIKNVPYEAIAINQTINMLNEFSKIKNYYFINPLNDDALDYYSYKLKNGFSFKNDTVIVLEIHPKVFDRPLFEGKLIFDATSHQLMEVQLKGGSQANDGTSDSLVLEQKFSLVDSNFNLPVLTRFSFLMNFMGFPYQYTQEYVYVNYLMNDKTGEPNISLNQSVILEPNLTYDLDFARIKLFGMPLTEEEEKHNGIIDAVFVQAPLYRKILMFLITDVPPLLLDRPARVGFFKINQFSHWYHFSKVDGHYLGFEYQIINHSDLNIFTSLGYAFASEIPSAFVRVRYGNWNLDINSTTTNLGQFPFNRSAVTYSALFNHSDDFHYYQSKTVSVNYVFSPISQIRITPVITYNWQSPLSNKTDYSLFDQKKQYKTNYEIQSYRNHTIGLSLGYYENFDYKLSSQTLYHGNSFTNVVISGDYGDRRILNASERRSVFNFDLHRYQEIYTPIRADVRIFGQLENKSDFIQEMNFVSRIQTLQQWDNPLSFFTLQDYDYQLRNYLRIRMEVTFWQFPKIFVFSPLFTGVFSALKSFGESHFAGFPSLHSNFYEYGAGLKELSMLNVYLLSNNLQGKNLFLRINISF